MGKSLRFIGIFFLSISALLNIAGGAGTTCVALNPTGFGDSFTAIADWQWLYILFVVVTLAFGIMMARGALLVVKGRQNAYRYAIISLVAAVLVGVIHMVVSRLLRNSSMPVDGVVYTTILTLIIFLIFKIPAVWQKVDFTKTKQKDSDTAGGAAAIVCGAISLTIQYLLTPTHTINGINYGDAFHLTTTVLGWGLVFFGLGLIVASRLNLRWPVLRKSSSKA